ncbi:RNA polymerase sigma-70 factor [Marinifilum fragile]|uniref:RNA polymerase sigma-70 factor n=1 Tax=Marinifilum fragile TaxID=570161 RepID=UPI0006D0779C|nr:RNA polymerase sigma-70 factor [Marinifilum fragile]
MARSLITQPIFEELFKEHYRSLYYHAYSILNDTEQARDLVNDSFEEIWNRRNKLDISYSLKSFLYNTVRNKCINYLRKQEVEKKYINRKKHDIHEEEEYKDYDSALLEIMKAVEQLPNQSRNVFKKCFIENLSYKEAAEELNVSVNTIKTHVTNSLKRLRRELNREMLMLLLIFQKK